MDSIDYQSLLKHYSQFQNSNFLDRYINYEELENYLKNDIFSFFDYDTIGYSELNKPIYSVDIGNGPKKILVWSQMHGNETTTTKAILDFLNYIKFDKSNSFIDYFLNTCQLKIIPVLNPDGSSNYTRFNANEVDLNRDAIHRSQKETKHFFTALETFKPDYCFNMHGQRTIFSAGKQNKPATLSFLAPSYNDNLNINKSREEAMKLIIAANEMLSDFIPNQIGRYDDAHNPNCFGDQIQKMGIPTVLFEAGHYPGDYNRNETRKLVKLSLVKMLECISYSNFDEFNLEDYNTIPKNEELYLDVIIKNIKNSDSGYIGIQYNEILEENKIVFKPYIKITGDLSNFHAHRLIDANYKPIKINKKSKYNVDQIIENIKIGSDVIDLKIVK